MLNQWKIVKHITAIYPIGAKTIVVRAERKRRKWEIASIETIPDGYYENAFEVVTRIAFNSPFTRKGLLLVILPRSDYFFSRGTYPGHLEENIRQVLTYDMAEHVFFKNGCSVLTGDIIGTASSVIASLYWAKHSTWDSFAQDKIKEAFDDVLIIPDAMVLAKGLGAILSREAFSMDGIETLWGIFPVGNGQIHALHVIPDGMVTESVIADPHKSFVWKMLRYKLQASQFILYDESLRTEDLKSLGIDPPDIKDSVKDTDTNRARGSLEEKPDNAQSSPVFLPFQLEDMIRNGISRMLDDSVLIGFDHSVRINLPKIPRWAYIVLIIFACYALFAGYMVFESKHLSSKLARIKKERLALEEQWKPIEQQMKIVEQMEQDKKTLESLTAQTMPLRRLIEILSKTTPKDTWVNNFILTQGNKIILRGDSKSAVHYMGELSKIAGFKDVKFISPVRKDAGTDKEFFNIEITVDWNEFKQALQK